MIVETRAITRWKIDEEKFFAIVADEWEDFLGGEEADEWDKKEFVNETLWANVPDFEYFGGVEIYDDFEIDVEHD